MIHAQRPCRRAATLVEAAIILPLTFLLTLGTVVGAVGMFRYQQVAHLAREGARYAATHGGRYQEDGLSSSTGVPAITDSNSLRDYLTQQTIGLDPQYLTVEVKWETMNSSGQRDPAPGNYPAYVDPNSVPPGQANQNYVVVTVKYTWFPEAFLFGPITITSTAEMPMSY